MLVVGLGEHVITWLHMSDIVSNVLLVGVTIKIVLSLARL